MGETMNVSLFDFELPEDRIALRPVAPRDNARLMVVHRDGRLEHRRVTDLPDYTRPGDAVVINDTKVIAARLRGVRTRDGVTAKIEILLHRRLTPSRFAALSRPARKLVVQDVLTLGDLRAHVVARNDGGEVEIDFSLSGQQLDAAIAMHGEMPLPPYIAKKRKADARDSEDYQTIFAKEPGSAAAPTASLHFTPALLSSLKRKDVICEAVTLQVGLGTFLPMSVGDTNDHKMHAEHAFLDAETAARLNATRDRGGRVLAVGTTSLRTLESAADERGILSSLDCDTDIFITPGYRFRAVDILMTNFHLPRSTLFMLVCAFSGMEVMRSAYLEAIRLDYRFYSYGDACLLMNSHE